MEAAEAKAECLILSKLILGKDHRFISDAFRGLGPPLKKYVNWKEVLDEIIKVFSLQRRRKKT